MQPFSNIVTTMTLTGAQIETDARAAVHDQHRPQAGQPATPRPTILLPSTGFTYTWDAGRHRPVTASTRTRSKLNDEPIDPAGTYRVVVNNFLATGGDDFPILNSGTERVTGDDDLVALEAYLADHNPYTPVDLATQFQITRGGTLTDPRPGAREGRPRKGRPSSRRLDQGEPVERERRHRQRLHGQPDEEQRRVIGRRSVGVEHAAAGAAVDEHPLALAADGDGDRFHA